MKGLLKTDDDFALTIIRLTLGAVFFAHGSQKVLGWFGGYGFSGTLGFFTQKLGIPAAFACLDFAAELLGGIGLILGCLTRIAAFGIACVMAVAVFMVHIHFGFFMNWGGTQKGEGFEYHILAIALSIALIIKGGGAFSVDRALSGGAVGRQP